MMSGANCEEVRKTHKADVDCNANGLVDVRMTHVTGAGATVRGGRSLLSPRAALTVGEDTAMADVPDHEEGAAEHDENAAPGEASPRRAAARLAADAAARRATQAAAPAGAAMQAAAAQAAAAHAALGEKNTAASWQEAARQEAGKANPAVVTRSVCCETAVLLCGDRP